MPHFNPQACKPWCCFDCSGKITELCRGGITWETKNALQARIINEANEIVAIGTSGFYSPTASGTYTLQVQCVNGAAYIDADSIIIEEDVLEEPCSCCQLLFSNPAQMGTEDTTLAFDFEGDGHLAQLNGTYLNYTRFPDYTGQQVRYCYAVCEVVEVNLWSGFTGSCDLLDRFIDRKYATFIGSSGNTDDYLLVIGLTLYYRIDNSSNITSNFFRIGIRHGFARRSSSGASCFYGIANPYYGSSAITYGLCSNSLEVELSTFTVIPSYATDYTCKATVRRR